jgi:hypothetical protein
MKQTLAAYQQRFAELLQLAVKTRDSFKGLSRNVLYKQLFQDLRTGSLELLDELYSKDHHVYRDVEKLPADKASFKQIDAITSALRSALEELEDYEQPPVVNVNLFEASVAAALRKGNKALAVMMASSALEERLEQLCDAHGIKFPGAATHVGPEQRNMALLRQGFYNRTKQKQVSGWISLRNSAAHGVQTDLVLVDVERMLSGVLGFLSEFPVPEVAAEPPVPAPEAPAATPWPTPSPEAQAKTLKNMRKRLRQVKEILAAEDITDAKKLKKIRFVVNLLLPDKEQPDTEKAPA